MARKVLTNNTGKGTSTLGSKAGNVTGAFAGGKATTKKAARINTGKNTANSSPKGKKGSLSLSKKDGMRSGGNASLSAKSRGPVGKKRK